ncbi:MAG: hypothetical protein IJR36_06795, partial [Lachnospiraceae bacterium]|nr:hypothetical protein [Lachnospiraceae bacterium]
KRLSAGNLSENERNLFNGMIEFLEGQLRDVMTSDGETAGVAFDDTFKAYFEDPEFGEATIVYEENLDCYMLHCAFRKTGDVVLILESPEGQRYEYDMTVERNTYQIKRRE